MKRLFKNNIDARINKFTEVLIDSQRNIGKHTGWHQHLKSPKIGIVATAMAMIYLKTVGEDCPKEKECLDFIKSMVRPDGGWSYISNATAISNVESTCWALLALAVYDPNGSKNLIERGVKWLCDCIDINNKDNGWGFSKESKPRTVITALTLKTLYALGKDKTPEFESGLHWLVRSQNEDGGWGATPEDSSSIFFTSYCISTLMLLKKDPQDHFIKKAKLWLDESLKKTTIEDPSLVCYMEFIENGSGENRIRITYFHYVLPFVAKAYMNLGCKNLNLFKAIYTLMERSTDGIIEHPNLENSKIYPIWALYDTSMSLITYKDLYESVWDKAYVYSCIFNRICWFRSWSPLRPITLMGNWIWGLVAFAIVAGLITWFSDEILNWWNSVNNKPLGGFLISLAASIVYGVSIWFIHFLKRKIPK